MITSYGPQQSKGFTELSLIYGTTAAKEMNKEQNKSKKRQSRKRKENK